MGPAGSSPSCEACVVDWGLAGETSVTVKQGRKSMCTKIFDICILSICTKMHEA